MGWVNRSAIVIVLVACGCDEGGPRSAVERSFMERGLDQGVVAVASARRISRDGIWEQKRPTERDKEHPNQNVVQVFGDPGYCPPCKRFQTWWNSLNEQERLELPVRFAYREDSIPEFATRWGRPAFYWQGKNGQYWKLEGWPGIEEFLKNYRDSK